MECMQLHIYHKPPSHTTYGSPSSQNEMIQSCYDIVTAVITSEIKATQTYSIIVDEAKGWHSRVWYVTSQGMQAIAWILQA